MELYILLQSGITFADGALMMQDDEPDAEGKALLQDLIDCLDRGLQLSSALDESGHFPTYMIHMVQVGEETGRLAETLKALAEYYDQQERLKMSIKNAVLYPSILLVMMVAVVMILIVKVLPIFNGIFTQLGSQMSPLAIRLMQFGRWLENTAVLIAVILCVIIAVAVISWLIPSVRKSIGDTFKNLMGSNSIFTQIAAARFASAMTLSLASGLDTEKAVEMASTVSGGIKVVDEKHKKCIEMLRSGAGIADSMRTSEILTARDSRMLALGVRSGTTDTVIADIARRADRNVQDGIDRMVSKIEPTLVIITSIIVGIILFSVMLPLMGIMTSIG